MEPTDVGTVGAILVNMGVVTGLTEAVKRALGPNFSTERWGPLLSIVMGIATGVAGAQLGWYDAPIGTAALQGITAGLGGAGIYAGARSPSRS